MKVAAASGKYMAASFSGHIYTHFPEVLQCIDLDLD